MRNLVYILLFVCSAAFSQTTWYVKPEGNDSNTGLDSLDSGAWKTWQKGLNSGYIDPGDTVYFMGGRYVKDLADYEDGTSADSGWYYNGSTGIDITIEGTEGNYIHFFNYPGEVPILDCVDQSIHPTSSNQYGIRAYSAPSWIHMKGLQVKNVRGRPNDPGVLEGSRGRGIAIGTGTHVILESCVVDNAHATGFTFDECVYAEIINCDALNIADSLYSLPGSAGTGFSISNSELNSTDSVLFTGCRAYQCSDQGWSTGYNNAYVRIDSCWSFDNGYLAADGGHGYKLGWDLYWSTYDIDDPPITNLITNSIAAFNAADGFTTNDNGNLRNKSMDVYNNISYYNGYKPIGSGYGFVIFNSELSSQANQEKRRFKNNISFDNEAASIYVDTYPTQAYYTHSNNTWDGGGTVTAADFSKSLDSTSIHQELLADRNEDGSLPEMTYFQLAEGSDLVDAGVDVGLPYLGLAPDIGAYESFPPLPSPAVGYKLTGGDGKILTDGNGKIIIGR